MGIKFRLENGLGVGFVLSVGTYLRRLDYFLIHDDGRFRDLDLFWDFYLEMCHNDGHDAPRIVAFG